MSDEKKKDLTRIEDLGEYLHELNSEDSFEEALPDLPQGEEETESTLESSSDFMETPQEEEGGLDFGSTDFSSGDFGSDNTFPTQEDEVPPFTEQSTEDLSFPTEESTPVESTDLEASFESFTDSLEEVPEENEATANMEPEPAQLPEPEPEPELDLEPEPIAEMSTPVAPPPAQEYKAPENFEDLKKFAENTSFTGMGVEGNPSFSVLIRNVRFIEDVNDILALMKELSLLADSEEQTKNRLMRGSLLVPRISEYAAVLLAHKLRRFDIDIQVGLSDEIHPPKHKEAPEVGVVSKFNLYQNQKHHFHFDDPKIEISQIIVAATPGLEGHQVVRYMGVASEHKMLDGHVVEDEASEEVPRHYQELAQKLKAHALKAHANAVVGLNYQLTPLPSEYGASGTKYRLTCTGNLVWVNKL